MIGQLYGTAENGAGFLLSTSNIDVLESARGPLSGMPGVALDPAISITVGRPFGWLVTNT